MPKSTPSIDQKPTVVYIHGIGNKPTPDVLKRNWDLALFGKELGSGSRVAYWADLRYQQPLQAAALDVAAFSDTTLLWDTSSNPEGEQLEARLNETILGFAESLRAENSDEDASVSDFQVRVLPFEWLRRKTTALFTKAFTRDVAAYLYEPQLRAAIRARLRTQLIPEAGPYIIVSHSMGTIIAYDVLREMEEAKDFHCHAWFTLGSPLGIREVQDHLGLRDNKQERLFKQLRIPKNVRQWLNFADRLDAVALDGFISRDFKPAGFIQDIRVVNPDRWNSGDYGPHSATGYLSTPQVKAAMTNIVGAGFTDFVANFIIARDVASEMDGIPKRLPVLIELDDALHGDDLDSKAAGLEAEIIGIVSRSLSHDNAPDARQAGAVERLRRYVAARLTSSEISILASRHDALKIGRIWRDSQKSALIERSGHVVQAFPAQHGYLATGEGIEWAVLDTGIAGNHPHFAQHNSIRAVWDCTQPGAPLAVAPANAQDWHGHGTHVAGIIAGEFALATPSGQTNTLTGMAPQAGLHAYKVLDDFGRGSDSQIIKAIDHIASINERAGKLVIHGVNLSLGGPFDPSVYGCGFSPICNELRRLWRQGVLVCLAAGNEGLLHIQGEHGIVTLNTDLSIGDPANLEEAIAVGSVHRDSPHLFGPSYFSSRGPTADGRMKPDLVAPGERILSCNAYGQNTTDYYIYMSGTSMACPHVSGILAGFLSVRREFIGFPDRVKQILLANCTSLNRDRTFQGHGLPNLVKMLMET